MSEQVLSRTVFSRELTLNKVTPGDNAAASVRASWELRYPQCFTRLCVQFREGGPEGEIIVSRCLDEEEITANELVESSFECNVFVGASVTVTDNAIVGNGEATAVIYTGGMFAWA